MSRLQASRRLATPTPILRASVGVGRWLLLLALVVPGLLASGSGFAADQAERAAMRRAYEGLNAAHKAQDWPTMLARSRELVALAPRSTRALYTLARAQSRNGQAAEAVASLMRLADLGIRFDLARDEDLKPLAGRPDFLAVTDRMQALLAPIGTSAAAFSLPEKDLLTEAVVHDAKTGAFFVSSVHRRKVVKVDAGGATADFVREGQNGLFAAMGLAVDPARRSLYVSSEAVPLMTGFRKEDEGRSAVFEFDLDTARLRRRVEPPGEGARCVRSDGGSRRHAVRGRPSGRCGLPPAPAGRSPGGARRPRPPRLGPGPGPLCGRRLPVRRRLHARDRSSGGVDRGG